MNKNVLFTAFKSDALLLLTAIIWGFAFVAQRLGMEHIEPFLFNGLRFALGSISLLPFVIFNQKSLSSFLSGKFLLKGSVAGCALFLGASLQQVGIVYTTAGDAGFITGLYVIIVPMIGMFFKQKVRFHILLSAIMAVIGLYLISGSSGLSIGKGNFIVLLSAFFWAAHVQLIGYFTKEHDSIKLAMIQFAVCSLLSLIVSAIFESFCFADIQKARIPILYGGLMSVGIAYTLQVVAQKNAQPAHASVILSLESVFALTGGIIILGEQISLRSISGSSLMLTAMVISQIKSFRQKNKIQNL